MTFNPIEIYQRCEKTQHINWSEPISFKKSNWPNPSDPNPNPNPTRPARLPPLVVVHCMWTARGERSSRASDGLCQRKIGKKKLRVYVSQNDSQSNQSWLLVFVTWTWCLVLSALWRRHGFHILHVI
jgi:hypothetical protein